MLTALGLVILGLISGSFLYGPHKEKDMDSKEGVLNAAELKGVGERLDASLPERIETATFAMG